MKKLSIFLLAAALFACQSNPNESSEAGTSDEVQATEEHVMPEPDMSKYPELLVKVLEAHGGLQKWQSYKTLRFQNVGTTGNPENQLIDLHNRKSLIDRDTVKIGFDGNEVWVSPDLQSFGRGSARFYHNLYFYFFGMPFLFADNGIVYEDLGKQVINDKEYLALKISYNEGVGDADSDVYIGHFNPETYKMELLLYTVTFYSGEKSTKYNALGYTDWQEVDGLLVPQTFTAYVYEDGKLGKERHKTSYNNVSFSTEAADQTLFAMPEVAEIDTLRGK